MGRAGERMCSVNAAHAVDGDFLDEELFGDDCFGDFGLVGCCCEGVLLIHGYESTFPSTH